MQTALDCIPCFARQALEAARFVTDDESVHEQVMRGMLRAVADMDLTQSPPTVAQHMHRRLRELTGDEDPYRQVKDRFNRMAMDLLPSLSAKVQESFDSLSAAVRLAVAGNAIDFGVNGGLTEQQAQDALHSAVDGPFHGNMEELRQAAQDADDILYLADNAGEIVFDRFLVEQLPPGRVTLAVRGNPILNDVTVADAQAVGFVGLAEIIDNGSDAPGTILSDCEASFRKRFAGADMIIAKGQGNFETLSQEQGNIFFLLKVKCPVISNHIQLPVGTHAVIRWPRTDCAEQDKQ